MDLQGILERAKEGDEEAREYIIRKYTPLVLKCSMSVYIVSYEQEDLRQIGYESILRAIEKFDPKKNSNFTAYVRQAIQKNYYNLIRKKSRTNYEASLNSTIAEGIELQDTLIDDFNLEEDAILREDMIKLRKALKILTEEEKELITIVYGKEYGGLTEYSNRKGINYNKCVRMRDHILRKLKEILLE